jgi:hypothetical protein
MSVRDLIGQLFGRLLVTGRAPNGKRGEQRWRCVCTCPAGTEKIVAERRLLAGATKSCGCLQRETASRVNATHGHTRGGRATPEYLAWRSMRDRCNNPNNSSYAEYSGRGVCPEWDASFEVFLAYLMSSIGMRPSSRHSIDRIDNTRGYEPGNIRWATPRQQANNRRSSRPLTIGDLTKTVAEWAHEGGVPPHLVYSRLKLGWPSQVLFIPAGASSLTHLTMTLEVGT